tara:strand:- start:39 stop:263 length:225 start_codon:yes stop_codon:yes gene_type:complete
MFTAFGAIGIAHWQHRICAGRQGASVSGLISAQRLRLVAAHLLNLAVHHAGPFRWLDLHGKSPRDGPSLGSGLT